MNANRKFTQMAFANLQTRFGKNVTKLFHSDVIEQLLLAEAALLVLAQAGEKYEAAQNLIRACINDDQENEG